MIRNVCLVLLFALAAEVANGNPSKRYTRKWQRRFEDDDAAPKPSAIFLIGSDQQSVDLQLDFTSRDTWVTDKNCGNELCYMGNSGFDPNSSGTFKNSTIPFKGSFYDETDIPHTVSGHAVIDQMQLDKNPPVTKPWTSVFALVNKRDTNESIGNWPYDGAVGLAPGTGDLLDPVFPHLLKNSNDKVVTIWMHVDDGWQYYMGFYPGSYEFDWLANCDNTTYFTTPVTEENTWRFAANGVKIGAYTRVQREQVEIQAETMLTGVPAVVYRAIVSATGASKGSGSLLEVDCSKHYADFQLTIGSKTIVGSEDVYISRGDKDKKCRLLLYPTSTSGFAPAWKLGYLWFYEMCLHFNASPLSVGFSHQTW